MIQRFFAGLLNASWLPGLVLVLLVLAPYHKLLLGQVIPIPDDGFISDLVDGEFPVRVELGRLLRSGESPQWLSGVFTGAPGSIDPYSAFFFTFLPPALALGWMISFLLAVAALGSYVLARQIGASCLGALFAGFAYSWSGFFVCQLRHLAILAVVSFFPLALFCLEKAASGSAHDVHDARLLSFQHRARWLLAFSAVFGLQILAGFPQSAYICALVYSALIAMRSVWLLCGSGSKESIGMRISSAGVLAGGFFVTLVLGSLIGMVVFMPIWDLGSLSDRSGGGTFEWATQHNYWGPNALSFFVPYINGDISNLTYKGESIFWEDYGYIGLATIILAVSAFLVRIRRLQVAFWGLITILAYMLVLGKITPLYKIAFDFVPYLSSFRFPTRFLFVVELGLALLAALGLSILQQGIIKHLQYKRAHFIAGIVAVLLIAATVIDLVYHNKRQNPFADADTWLSTPQTAALIKASGEEGRVYAPGSARQHIELFNRSKGWSEDLSLYYKHRELLQPNSNLLHKVATLDGYSGVSAKWVVDLIGDHNRLGLVKQLHKLSANNFETVPAFYDLLEALSVRWLILPMRVSSKRLEHIGSAPPVELYRLPDSLPRARVVSRARIAGSMEEIKGLMLAQLLDIKKEVLLHEERLRPIIERLEQEEPSEADAVEASIVIDRSTEIVIKASAPKGGLLLLADTFYPGWEASVDGEPTEIWRANIAQRAVLLSPGEHEVVFKFRSRSSNLGLMLSASSLCVLIAAFFIVMQPYSSLKKVLPK